MGAQREVAERGCDTHRRTEDHNTHWQHTASTPRSWVRDLEADPGGVVVTECSQLDPASGTGRVVANRNEGPLRSWKGGLPAHPDLINANGFWLSSDTAKDLRV